MVYVFDGLAAADVAAELLAAAPPALLAAPLEAAALVWRPLGAVETPEAALVTGRAVALADAGLELADEGAAGAEVEPPQAASNRVAIDTMPSQVTAHCFKRHSPSYRK